MAVTATKTAFRYWCPARVSAHCQHGTGKPRAAKCHRCGSEFLVQAGIWGVFEWRGDGRYRLEDAASTYVRLASAEKARKGDQVVRFVASL